MFANSDELLKYIKDEGVEMVDVRFCDLPGIMQHFTVPVSSFNQDVFDDGLNFDGSSVRGFQAIHESDMSLFPDPTTAYLDPFRAAKTLVVNFFIHDPLTGEAYSRDPRNIARKAQAYLASTGIGDTAYFAPEAEFYVFDSVRFETKQNAGYYHIDSEAGAWNTGSEDNNRGYKVKYKGGYFPVAPYDHFGDLRDEIVIEMEKTGLRRRACPPRGRHRRPGRDQLALRRAAQDRRRRHEVQVPRQERRLAQRQDRDVHAEADLRRQRLGHALPPVDLERRRAAVLRRDRVRRPVRHGALLHRRHPQARPVAAGVHQPDGELLPPPGARLRGSGQPGLQPAQPVGLRPDPDHGLEPEGQAHRVPLPRPVVEPVPRVLRDAAGRHRRHQEQDRAARAGRQGPLRAPAGRARRHPDRARLARRGARLARGRPRLPARGRRLHPRPDRDLDRLQAHRTRSSRSRCARTRTSSSCTSTSETPLPR